jgi:hypothetical protein
MSETMLTPQDRALLRSALNRQWLWGFIWGFALAAFLV